jgi:1-acyl-sn-glycerol-3-phosphate acyltransferase
MQHIIIEKPYKFIPPHRGTLWPWFIRTFNLHASYLRKHGIFEYECRHVDRLRQSVSAGHGILLTPNHSRPEDPIVMGWLAKEAKILVYAMASWHLFNQDRFTAWAIRKMGGFSVNREGVDRTAINTAIEALATAERPLILFPEGATTRTNDRLHALLDGVAFIARTAAKRRAKNHPGGKVVMHPIALKYLFREDLKSAVSPVLAEFEKRLTWQPQDNLPLLNRIAKLGGALLCLKEVEYFGQPQSADMTERLDRLIDHLLSPLEEEWLGGRQDEAVVPRVKALRMKITPDMVGGRLAADEYQRRWRQLADIYLAQQLSCYLPEYVASYPSVDRLLETVERFDEDLTDETRAFGKHHVIIEVGEAVEIDPHRDRKAEVDPLMTLLGERLQGMLDRLSLESPLYEPARSPAPVPAAAGS